MNKVAYCSIANDYNTLVNINFYKLMFGLRNYSNTQNGLLCCCKIKMRRKWWKVKEEFNSYE